MMEQRYRAAIVSGDGFHCSMERGNESSFIHFKAFFILQEIRFRQVFLLPGECIEFNGQHSI